MQIEGKQNIVTTAWIVQPLPKLKHREVLLFVTM